MAGRLTPGALRSTSIASAISAPVLPQEITTCDSPWRTVSSAFHMLEPWPRRSARDGFSSMAITLSAWRISVRSASGLALRSSRASSSPSPCRM